MYICGANADLFLRCSHVVYNECSFFCSGYITPFVVRELLGREGCFLLLTMLSMTLMSTGSGEVMSVSSILVYDVYKTYINPYR